MVEINGTTYFVAEDGQRGPELWKTDGTAAGTVLLKDTRELHTPLIRNLTNVN